MHRLFVAIRPPRPARERLLALMSGVPNARWQDEDQLHLTLRFIGEVDRHRAQDVAAALASVHAPSFNLSLQGAGHFGQAGRNETLWIGVTPHDAITALHKKVDQACRRVGLPSECRAYLPHITVARLGRSAGPIEPFLAAASGTASERFAIDSFCLYESELGSGGSVYNIVERYRLDGAGATPNRPTNPASTP